VKKWYQKFDMMMDKSIVLNLEILRKNNNNEEINEEDVYVNFND
jgi:hypothetical protein